MELIVGDFVRGLQGFDTVLRGLVTMVFEHDIGIRVIEETGNRLGYCKIPAKYFEKIGHVKPFDRAELLALLVQRSEKDEKVPLGEILLEFDLRGADLHDLNLRMVNLLGLNLEGANLQGANLEYADLRDTVLKKAKLHKAGMRNANLNKADLSFADLHNVRLSFASLNHVNLREANLYHTGLCDVWLMDSDLSGANLSGCDLYHANINRSNLSGANLSGTDLREAELCGANLTGADLRDAHMDLADLSGADLRAADLRGGDVRCSCWPLWEGTIHTKVNLELVSQLAYRLCAVQCEDKAYINMRNSILWFVNRYLPDGALEASRRRYTEQKPLETDFQMDETPAISEDKEPEETELPGGIAPGDYVKPSSTAPDRLHKEELSRGLVLSVSQDGVFVLRLESENSEIKCYCPQDEWEPYYADNKAICCAQKDWLDVIGHVKPFCKEAVLALVAEGKNPMVEYDLRGADLRDTPLRNSVFRGADLRGANLQGADLSKASLDGADLQGANLRKANLRGAEMLAVCLRGADLREADLREIGFVIDFTGADLRGANLQDASLGASTLQKANLQGANLQDGYLYNAELQGANLQGTNVSGANLFGTEWEDTDLRGADLTCVCLPLHSGTCVAKLDEKQAALLAYHLCALDCEDKDFIKLRNSILWFANTCHLVAEGRYERLYSITK